MYLVVIGIAAFLASGLTLFSGFGLGTLLMPVIALFLPVEVAVAITAVVHLINNFAKLAIIGRYADKRIVLWFGIPATMAAGLGAWLLGWLSHLAPLTRYYLLGHRFDVAPIKVVIAVLLLVFVLIEFQGLQKTLPVKHSSLPLGGVLSGFFGGLSGNQGAFRSAYLVKTGLSKEQFLGTGAVIACLVDLSRLVVYGTTLPLRTATQEPFLLLTTIVAALGGTMVAARFIQAIRMETIKRLVAAMLIGIAIGLGSGLI